MNEPARWITRYESWDTTRMIERKSTRTTKARIEPTKHDKGLTLQLTVKVYDGGVIQLDGEPMNRGGSDAQGYVAVASAIAEKLWMLQYESDKRSITQAPAEPIEE